MLSADQLATELGVSVKTIYRRWEEWGLKAYKFGGCLRFKRTEVRKWIEGNALV